MVPECDGMIKYEQIYHPRRIYRTDITWLGQNNRAICRAIQDSQESIAKLSKYFDVKPKTNRKIAHSLTMLVWDHNQLF